MQNICQMRKGSMHERVTKNSMDIIILTQVERNSRSLKSNGPQ